MSARGEMPDLYFITDKRRRYVKIGISRDCEQRLHSLQAGSPIDLQLEVILPNGGKFLEISLHQHFAKYWKHREWFTYGPPIREMVETLKAGTTVSVPSAPYPRGMYDKHGVLLGYEATLRQLKKIAR